MLHHPDADPTSAADYLDRIAAEQAAPLAEAWGAFAYAVSVLCGAALVVAAVVAVSAPAVALFLGR